jgi:antitoxin (DNA-binding transcriptional repressor) of toxin-antitoxin stability system
MDAQIIGIKQLHKDLSKISEEAKRGQSFIVVKNSKPVFRIEPVGSLVRPRYTIKDFEKIRFKSNDKNLSRHIDKILYG